MTHLTDEQIVDAMDGSLLPAAAAHVSACAACASKVGEARNAFREAAGLDVPDPSPLFWQHFAERVNAAIDHPPVASGWGWPRVAGWATAVLLVIGVIAIFAMRSGEVPRQIPVVQTPAGDVVEPIPIDEDEAWAVVRTLATDLHYEDAHEAGVMPRAGAVDRAATELSEEERAELVRLLENELKRTGA